MRIFFAIYALLSIAVIAVQIAEWDPLENVLKPLLMPSLFGAYIFFRKERFLKIDFIFLVSILFSWLGDVFLMPLFNHFMAGLLAFLSAHLLYIYIFTKEMEKPVLLDKKKKILLFASIGLYVFLMSFIMLNLLPQKPAIVLILAIFIYATALFGVFTAALFRIQSPIDSYNYILIGALLFLISDGFLAINKFVMSLPYSPLLIISSYATSQAFIVYGFIKRKA